MNADRAAYLQDHHHEERRQTERRISPAIGEFAVQECERLRVENARLREALRSVVYDLAHGTTGRWKGDGSKPLFDALAERA